MNNLVLDTIELSFLSVFVPLSSPVVGADTKGELPIPLALLGVVGGLLQANEPFIVTIPAVQSLVLRRETMITRSSTDVLHLVQKILLGLSEVRDFVAENLR